MEVNTNFRNTTNLWAHTSTVTCALQGCTVCCYKIIVKLPKNEFGKHVYQGCKSNERPENCLRLKGDQEAFSFCKALELTPLKSIKILVVGDGNFSFSLSFFSQFLKNNLFQDFSLVTSTYFAEKELEELYPDALSNIEKLSALRDCTVLYNIDATNFKSSKKLTKEKFNLILFNFPCVDAKVGNDAQSENKEENVKLVQDFLDSASSILSKDEGSKIIVTHKTKEPFSWWHLDKMQSAAANPTFSKKVIFDKSWFPDYTPRKVRFGIIGKSKNSFPIYDAVMFIYQTNKYKPEMLLENQEPNWNSELLLKNDFVKVSYQNLLQIVEILRLIKKNEIHKRKTKKSQANKRKKLKT